jgi:hypothetical protein
MIAEVGIAVNNYSFLQPNKKLWGGMVLAVSHQHQVRYSQCLDLDSLIASRMSLVVARVSIPGTSKGDFWLLLKMIEKDSPPLRFITTPYNQQVPGSGTMPRKDHAQSVCVF